MYRCTGRGDSARRRRWWGPGGAPDSEPTRRSASPLKSAPGVCHYIDTHPRPPRRLSKRCQCLDRRGASVSTDVARSTSRPPAEKDSAAGRARGGRAGVASPEFRGQIRARFCCFSQLLLGGIVLPDPPRVVFYSTNRTCSVGELDSPAHTTDLRNANGLLNPLTSRYNRGNHRGNSRSGRTPSSFKAGSTHSLPFRAGEPCSSFSRF